MYDAIVVRVQNKCAHTCKVNTHMNGPEEIVTNNVFFTPNKGNISTCICVCHNVTLTECSKSPGLSCVKIFGVVTQF